MEQYLVDCGKEKRFNHSKEKRLSWLIDSMYKNLTNLYGAQGLILRASKLDAIDLMNSSDLMERLVALEKILRENPAIKDLQGREPAEVLKELEELMADTYARKTVEEELQQRIQEKMDQRQDEYFRQIKRQVIKEQQSSTENAATLKKLGQLEIMERTSLNQSALEILRPSCLEEIIGQEQALKSLISKLNTPYPQHILLYGPPGVGKTTCARLALELIKGKKESSFKESAPFIEVDGTTLRWDPRESTNPLLGSVHDPIYQGAKRELADEGIPEPKMGLVSEAHGGILFIDEIGEMDLLLQNKLLKVMEDKRVFFESSYYDPHDEKIPQYIKHMFNQGVPADFVLIGATTRRREDISPAFRSRCMEIFFEPLTADHIKQIVANSSRKLGIDIEKETGEIISRYTADGRGANKILVDAYAIALNQNNTRPVKVSSDHIYAAIHNSRITPHIFGQASADKEIGKIFGVGAAGYLGTILELEAIAFSAETGAQGKIRFNDTAGSMVRDSVFNAASVLRKESGKNLYDYDLHVNIIGGGCVDGPSAGAAIYLAIFSAIEQKLVRQDVAITGELSIQGKVKPVGALHEKIYGAKQAGIKEFLIPAENLKDIPQGIAGIDIIPIQYINEAYSHVFVND
ncbi:MAG: Lon family ATP-dependent protease [Syntrophomonadaceae bacterium]|nr:Lon family ATP-dependent protease [Syntrophomonadaceae bacterium]MDD3888664.1 Lon family ATP-dependent protease [Syntrophomonadaceae bacterium]MDD4548520.1 Lon family ATP-dependent protease [Syntrophomonadaceae bacterium]